MRFLVGALSTEVSGDGAIIIKLDPLHLLIESAADGDVEVGYFPIVEDVARGWLIERGLIVEDLLLQTVESVFVPFCGYSGVGLSIGDGLKEAVSNASE
jgi:hypothetical protein